MLSSWTTVQSTEYNVQRTATKINFLYLNIYIVIYKNLGMDEEKTRWYNSEVGCGVAAFFILVGVGGCNYLAPQFSKSICERLFPEAQKVTVGSQMLKVILLSVKQL